MGGGGSVTVASLVDGIISARDSEGLRGEAFDYFVNCYLIHVTQI